MDLVAVIAAVGTFITGGALTKVINARSTRRQAAAEAKKAEAEAEATEIENDATAIATFQTYVVDPLKKEVTGLRRDIKGLHRAIAKISECPHSIDCPVRTELKSESEDDESK